MFVTVVMNLFGPLPTSLMVKLMAVKPDSRASARPRGVKGASSGNAGSPTSPRASLTMACGYCDFENSPAARNAVALIARDHRASAAAAAQPSISLRLSITPPSQV
jgi:hypothetical protein